MELTPSPASSRYCSQCGVETGSAANFCSTCGASLTGSQKESKFGAFGFRSRWLILVLPLAYVAAFVDLYLFYVVLVAYIFFVIGRNKLSIRAFVGRVPSNYNWWPLVLMGIGGLAFSIGASVITLYPLVQLDSEFATDLFEEVSLGGSLSAFVVLVILAPLIEEILFRGLLFTRLTKKWGMIRAMIVSSLVFGLLHLNPIGAFVFGIVTCVLYMRTRTLLVPMALHALNNLIAWLWMFAEEGAGKDFTSPEFLTQYVYQGLIAMLFGAPIVFILLGRWWPSRGTPIPYEANKGDTQLASSAS
jgi:membrane protease YdiL (CAAX protease family)